MIQNLLVVLIVTGAFIWVVVNVYRSVIPGEKPKSACGGCKGCELKNMKEKCEHTS
jgi:hypothetical protein